MSDRQHAERVTPKPVAGETLCVVVPVTTLEVLGQFVAAGLREDALAILRALRNGPRRLEPTEEL